MKDFRSRILSHLSEEFPTDIVLIKHRLRKVHGMEDVAPDAIFSSLFGMEKEGLVESVRHGWLRRPE